MMTIKFSQDTYTVKPDNIGISVDQNGKVTIAETAVPGTEATLMPILVLEVTMARSIFHPLKLFGANK